MLPNNSNSSSENIPIIIREISEISVPCKRGLRMISRCQAHLAVGRKHFKSVTICHGFISLFSKSLLQLVGMSPDQPWLVTKGLKMRVALLGGRRSSQSDGRTLRINKLKVREGELLFKKL